MRAKKRRGPKFEPRPYVRSGASVFASLREGAVGVGRRKGGLGGSSRGARCTMLTREDVSALLTLMSEAIEREGIEREHDTGRGNRRFYHLVDLRNRLLATFMHVGGPVRYATLSKQLTMKLGKPRRSVRWN